MEHKLTEVHRGLSVVEVAAFLGVSRSMVFKLEKTDRSFPRPAKIGRVKRWIASDVSAWFAAKRRAK